MTDIKKKMMAFDLAQKWYKEEYGGYHWNTADELVENFLLWLLEKYKIKEKK